MKQGICENCINQFVINNSQLGGTTCILNNKIYPPNVYKCLHFEERPKDNSKNFDEAKQTANKGKPPRKQPKKNLCCSKCKKRITGSYYCGNGKNYCSKCAMEQ